MLLVAVWFVIIIEHKNYYIKKNRSRELNDLLLLLQYFLFSISGFFPFFEKIYRHHHLCSQDKRMEQKQSEKCLFILILF